MKHKPTLKKFAAWLSSELNSGNFTPAECEAMHKDFAAMSETRLKRLAVNFNL